MIKLKIQNKLDNIDICILTDGLLTIEQSEEKYIEIKSLNIKCKIYYWDLKKWNDLKRSKTKRLPININFQENSYSFYKINYIYEIQEEDEDASFEGLAKFIEEDEEGNLLFYVYFEEDSEEVCFYECDIIKKATPEELEDWKNNLILDFVDNLNKFINE